MSDIDQKALALVNEVGKERGLALRSTKLDRTWPIPEALCRVIEAHEATKQELADCKQELNDYKQKVSDVASVCAQHFSKTSWTVADRQRHVDLLSQFIIPKPKPDPLVEVLEVVGFLPVEDVAEAIRVALNAHGLQIVEKNDDRR